MTPSSRGYLISEANKYLSIPATLPSKGEQEISRTYPKGVVLFFLGFVGARTLTKTKKQKQTTIIVVCSTYYQRSEADSNRCRRFCRPLVKPLAHQTIAIGCNYLATIRSANIQKNLKLPKLLPKIDAFSEKLLTLHRYTALPKHFFWLGGIDFLRHILFY